MPRKRLNGTEKFLRQLEEGVKDVLAAGDATKAERLQAINAGAKLIAIRHRIEGGDDAGFFS